MGPPTRATAPMRRWRWRLQDNGAHIALAVGAAITIGYFLLPSAELQDFAYQVPGMLAVVGVLTGIAIHRPAQRIPWLLLAAGQALTTAGDWTWVVLDRAFGIEPFPSVADAFYLSGIGLTGVAILWLVRGRIPDGDRAGVLDALIVAVGAGLVSWIYLMEPIVTDSSATLPEIIFALAYPLLDIVILGLLVRIALAPGRRGPALTMLLGALVALLASDFLYAGLALADGYWTGHPVEAGWLISAALYASAALHPSMRQIAAPVESTEVRLSPWRFLLLAGASLMAPAVLLVQWLAGEPIDVPVIAAASIVLFLLVIARLGGVVADLRANLRHRQILEAELQQRAFHDPLTGLANRTLFADRLGRALAQRDEPVAVLFLDLDDFKTINDSHGHQAGDELLTAVARTLSAGVRPEDTVARLGGDEFAVLIERNATEGIARQLADRLLAALRRPVRVAGRDRSVGASIGISLGRSGIAKAEQLMSEADIAMYVAKGDGKGGSSVFDPRTHASVVRSIGLRDDLDRAIRERQFEMHYQPIIDLETGDLAGVEALARWRHPTRGLLAPADFIAVAEATGTIIALGQWIFSESCRQAAAWSSGPLADGRFMSINLSTIQITYPGFVEFVTDAVTRAGVEPANLLVEVTESANPDPGAVADALLRLHGLGIRLAVDDFGTGFASMEQLARLPFAVIKIDRSLIAAVDTDARAESVVTGVTDLARRLGARCVAEGIERASQIAPLRAMGCQLAQGFHFAPALPPVELESLVAASTFQASAQARHVPRRVPS
ncbi:MAG TPA: EAL domain-containing protein [Candidatus Limnocylindria bacterium]|nr:EAL domain-containing protein [Candidatus Limnocylindria bacterium]